MGCVLLCVKAVPFTFLLPTSPKMEQPAFWSTPCHHFLMDALDLWSQGAVLRPKPTLRVSRSGRVTDRGSRWGLVVRAHAIKKGFMLQLAEASPVPSGQSVKV